MKQNRVFVLDKNKQPLMSCTSARARWLLTHKKAAVFLRSPFTIILTGREGGDKQPIRISVDPGSKQSGLAVCALFKRGWVVLWAAELIHRGQQVREALQQRAAQRRSRRARKTRYRKARFLHRRKPTDWLPPSLRSRIQNILTWVQRLSRFVGLEFLGVEDVKFDTQKLQNPEIDGIEYQQGTLFGYELREYLLEKFNRTCIYCEKKDVALQIEHVQPKSKGGSNRVSNLVIACESCNKRKNDQPIEVFLKKKPTLLASILQRCKSPLRDAAAVNSTRKALVICLQRAFPNALLEKGSGGQTKYNRTQQGYPKAHWIDAACVGSLGEKVCLTPSMQILTIQAMGRESRRMCQVDKYGFPSSAPKGPKVVHGFQTGDLIKAIVPTGKKQGIYTGRVAIRSSGSFNIKTSNQTIQGISYKHCQILQRKDGYSYALQSPQAPQQGETL